MEVIQRKLGEACVVQVRGRLDSGTANDLSQCLQHLIEGGERSLIVDGVALDYISSSGLRVLLVAAKQLKPLNGMIVLASLKPHILEVFQIAGFTSIFAVYPTVEEAAKAVSGPLLPERLQP